MAAAAAVGDVELAAGLGAASRSECPLASMAMDLYEEDGRLIWVRNPFTGTVTYFTEVHRKPSGFGLLPSAGSAASHLSFTSEQDRRASFEAARRECPFCPGNEHLTMEEVLRIAPDQLPGVRVPEASWVIRAFYNIVPRIPECCTGGRNESYVVVEDPRHFADGARHPDDVIYSASLSREHFQSVIRADVAVARLAYANPCVRAVLIRKNQGRESGASQPHVHNQVIGSDQPFAWIAQEQSRLGTEPALWQEIVAFAESRGFVIARQDDCVLYFSPFGVFPRSYEVVCLDVWQRIVDVDPERLDRFSAFLHQALAIPGPLPLDYEIHDGPGVPLHAHVSSRHYPYSNIGGTLNLPATMSGAARSRE